MSKLTSSGSRRLARAAVMSAALIVAGACNRAADQPKVPLNQSEGGSQTAQQSPHEQLTPEGRTALDSGNVAFRAGKYDAALKQYRLAANAEPKSAAPFFGIYMVALKQNNKPLADSVMAVIRSRASGSALTDSAMAKMHEAQRVKPAS